MIALSGMSNPGFVSSNSRSYALMHRCVLKCVGYIGEGIICLNLLIPDLNVKSLINIIAQGIKIP